jgi:single-stranded-DNA-specific exonuclease
MAVSGKQSAYDKHWVLQQPAPVDFIDGLGYGTVLASLLHQRGIRESEEIERFLYDTYPQGLHDPFLMKDMLTASKRLAQAIVEQEPIAVYGDYDTDGVTATTLLHQAVTAMGGKITPYIPHREREGYGLNQEAVEHLAAEGVRLLVTVDCGISNVQEVARAQALGMDVIVTDHHTPPATLPQALAVVNPKQADCTYPYDQLVGVGIAFKLVHSLMKQGIRSIPRGRDMLDLVALGTVADIAPLTGENRVLVKAGLEAIKMTERPGLLALIRAAGIDQKRVDSLAIGFRLAPRLNAAGRLDDARAAYELLLADDIEKAHELALELNQKNQQRQRMTEEMQQLARDRIESVGKHRQKLVVVAGEEYAQGVVGLVASRLVSVWNRPVIVLARGETMSSGSARSIQDFNIIQAMTECSDVFERFGGHSMAAGMTIKNERLAELEERLLAIAEQKLSDDMLRSTLHIDAEVGMDRLHWDLIEELALLEPFGNANQQPLLMTRAVQAVDVRTVGGSGQHLKLRLVKEGNERPLEAIAFRLGHLVEPLKKYPLVDVAYTLETHEWNDKRFLQLNIKDFRKAQQNLY